MDKCDIKNNSCRVDVNNNVSQNLELFPLQRFSEEVYNHNIGDAICDNNKSLVNKIFHIEISDVQMFNSLA